MSAPLPKTPEAPPTRPTEYEFHPLANLFPLLEGEEFKALVADIKKNGLREKITLHEGRILEGRNRYRACKEGWINPEYRDLPPGMNPLDYVLSANLHRRHLSTSQRALIGARLITLQPGQHTKGQAPSIEGAAKLLNIGHASIERARKVLNSGNADLIGKVEQDKITTAAAVKQLEANPKPKAETSNANPASTINSDHYDRVQKMLIGKLQKMEPEQAEASAQKTIEELVNTIRAKKGGRHSLKLAA
jgi:hypothetical protein